MNRSKRFLALLVALGVVALAGGSALA